MTQRFKNIMCTPYAHGGNTMVVARLQLNEYTNKVLGIVKIKYGLKDKSAAVNKFIEEYGNEILEKEPREEYIKELLEIDKDHMKKYEKKTMTLEELDRICGIDNV